MNASKRDSALQPGEKHAAAHQNMYPAFVLATCWVTAIIVYVNRMTVVALLPDIQSEFQLSITESGTLLSAIYIPYALVMIPAGLLASRLGLKRSILLGVAGFTVCTVVVSMTRDYASLVAAFIVYGAFLGIYLPAGIALISQWYRKRGLGRALGIHESAPPLGMIIGLLVSAALAESFGWRAPYLLYVLPGIIILVVFALWIRERDPVHTTCRSPRLIESLRGRGLAFYLVPFTANALCVYGLYAMLPLYLVGVAGLTLAAAAIVLSISRAGGVAGSFLLGNLSDRMGVDFLLITCMVLVGALSILFPLMEYGALAVIVLVAIGFFSLAVYPLTFSVIARRAPVESWPAINGFFLAFSLLLGGGFGPIIIGALADFGGFQMAFWVCGLLALVGGVVILPVRKM